MNAPVHFKQQLADELSAHAASLSAPTGHRALLRLPTPRRWVPVTVGLAAAAAAVAVAVPLVSGSPGAQQAAQTPHGAAGTGPGASAAPASPGVGLHIVNADYAVQSRPGGTVSVQLFDSKGISGLQAALDKAGIPAKVMVPSASCRTTGHTDSKPHGSLLKVMPQSGFHSNGVHDIKPSAIRPGDHLLFIAEIGGSSSGVLATRLVHQVPSCIPAD